MILLNIMYLCTDFVDWLEKKQATCLFRAVMDMDCPGCGMQRALIALLRGNFIESLKLYPALIPTTIMFGVLIVHVFHRLKHGANILISLFIINTVIIVVSYMCKLIN